MDLSLRGNSMFYYSGRCLVILRRSRRIWERKYWDPEQPNWETPSSNPFDWLRAPPRPVGEGYKTFV